MALKILADENIPIVHEAFEAFGIVETKAGRAMTREDVVDVDVLLVRSVTRVDAGLLEGSRVQFVGTATIGTDHIDQAYLAERGIGFSPAPASNADSVKNYITVALLELAQARGVQLRGSTLGVVGVGNIGKRVARVAEALGMRVLLNDPPRARAEGEGYFVTLEVVAKEADFITFHTPLNREGEDHTVHLADQAFFDSLARAPAILNTSRGPVVSGDALGVAIEEGKVSAALLDVWEGEPTIDVDLLEVVNLGSSHIAGYAFDGKIRGTTMLRDALSKHLGVDHPFDVEALLPKPKPSHIPYIKTGDTQEDLRRVCRKAYNILGDDGRLRETAILAESARGAAFDGLRKGYPVRREFSRVAVTAPSDLPGEARVALEAAGFTVEPQRYRYAYLHGFASSAKSRKGVRFAEVFEARGLTLELPDLNVPSFASLTYTGALGAMNALRAQDPAARWRLIGSSMGGYLAARWAALYPEAVDRLVLLCPGFDLPSRWPEMMGQEAFEAWEERGSVTIPDGAGTPTDLHWLFIEDARLHPTHPKVTCPTLIFHGRGDETVPIASSRQYAQDHPNVELTELDDDHRLLASAERIVEGALDFFHKE